MDDDIDFLSSFSSTSAIPARTPRIFDRFGSSSSSDNDGDYFSPSTSNSDAVVKTAGKKLDYMIQFLDRKLSTSTTTTATATAGSFTGVGPLPEFIGSGGGNGLFKVPLRYAVRPDRPVSVEVRPHPLRETQVGRGLKVMTYAAEMGEVWAGGESRVRVWKLGEILLTEEEDGGGGGDGRLGDEMTVGFTESSLVEEEVTCMVADDATGVVWSGHVDGKIRCWRMERWKEEGDGFTECLSWQAHRGPVFSMVVTSYGELILISCLDFDIML